VKVAARQGRLENIADIQAAAGGLPGAHQGMYFIEKQNNIGLLCFPDECNQPLLHLAAVLGSRQQAGNRDFQHPLASQAGGNISAGDFLCQPFHNGCLAGACLANQQGIVLALPHQCLDHTLNFVIPPQDCVELAF